MAWDIDVEDLFLPLFVVMGGAFMICLVIFSPDPPRSNEATDNAIKACQAQNGVPTTAVQGHTVVMTDCKFREAK